MAIALGLLGAAVGGVACYWLGYVRGGRYAATETARQAGIALAAVYGTGYVRGLAARLRADVAPTTDATRRN